MKRWSPVLFVVSFLMIGMPLAAWAERGDGAHENLNALALPDGVRAAYEGAWDGPLMPTLQQAADDYKVPFALLLTLGQMGSAFENRGGAPTIERGYGVMALRQNAWGGDSLALAAALTGASAERLKADPSANVRGAAAVLDAYATEAGVDRTTGGVLGGNELDSRLRGNDIDLRGNDIGLRGNDIDLRGNDIEAWVPVVTRYAGLDAESNQYFAMQVYQKLERGFTLTNSLGETFALAGQALSIVPESLAPPAAHVQSDDYAPAIWDPAASCNYSAYYTGMDTVVIHTIEGSASGARSWFKNCNAQASSHYVVSEIGTVWQMVDESYRAWHATCYNSRSVGIEHEGYAGSPSHPQSLYDGSALLTRDICDSWGIPKNYTPGEGPGILGHVDVNNCCCGGDHWDPGGGWDWGYYIGQIRGTPPPPAWDATYNAQSYPSSMRAGTTAIAWAEFNNTGTQAWYHCETKLGTSSPADRTSPFCTPANWACANGSNPGCNRPTDVDQSEVTQGQVGRFTFILTAPATPGTYTEKFRLLREGGPWFGPEITWTITVQASRGNLTGTVTHAANGAAVAGASVTLSGVGSTTTNGSGLYNFSDVNAGNYTVSVTATSFNPASDGVTINAGATTTTNFALTPSDTEPPTTPTGLTANAAGPTTVQLSWSASTDNVGVAGYDVRRNGAVIGSSPGTSYTDNSATPNATQTYEVRARDAVPNYSGWSDSASATTTPLPPEVVAAVSRKEHGPAGTFDLDVASTTAVEGRGGGPTQIRVAFSDAIQGVGGLDVTDVSLSSGTVTNVSIASTELAVEMSGASNAAKLVIGFPGIAGLGGVAVTDTLCFGVLAGDVTGDGQTNIFDLVTIRNALNGSVDGTNFTSDVNMDGAINVLDLVTVRNNLNLSVAGACP